MGHSPMARPREEVARNCGAAGGLVSGAATRWRRGRGCSRNTLLPGVPRPFSTAKDSGPQVPAPVPTSSFATREDGQLFKADDGGV